MVDTTTLVSETEALQIKALEEGATTEEASLAGRLPQVAEAPSAGQFVQPAGVSEADFQPPVEDARESVFTPGGNTEDSVFALAGGFPNNSSTEYIRSQALNLMLIKQAINPDRNPSELFEESFTELSATDDIEKTKQLYRTQFANQQVGLGAMQVQDGIATGTLTAETVEAEVEALQQFEDLYGGVDGETRILVDNYADVSLTQKIRDDFEVEQTAWSIYNEWLENNGGFGDAVLDFTGSFIGGDYIKDANDLVGGSAFSTLDSLKRFILAYQKANPQDRIEMFSALFPKMVEDYEDNRFKLQAVIGAMHDPEFSRRVTEDAVFDSVVFLDIFGGAIGASRAVRGFAKSVQLNKKLNAIGARQEAAQATTANSGNENTNLVGGSSLDASVTSSPWKMEDTPLGVGTTDDLSDEMIRESERLAREIEEEIVTPIADINQQDIITIAGIRSNEQNTTIQAFTEELKNQTTSRGFLFRNAEVTERDSRGFTVEYEVVDPNNGKLVLRRREPRLWRRTDIGDYAAETKAAPPVGNILLGYFTSPEFKFNRIDPHIVEATTLGRQQEARLGNMLTTIAKTTDAGLSRKQRQGLDELIAATQENIDEATGRIEPFKMSDLRSGNVELASGKRRYTQKEVDAYYKRLSFNQQLHQFAEHRLKRDLEFQGAKTLNVVLPRTDDPIRTIGIPRENFRGVVIEPGEPVLAPGLSGRGTSIVPGRAVRERFQELSAEGYIPVQLVDDAVEEAGKKVRWAIVKDEGKDGTTYLSRLPDNVLPNLGPGYSPRIARQGTYFIKNASKDASGNPIPAGATLRTARTLREAEDFVEAYHARQKAEGVPKSERLNLVSFRDRDIQGLDSLVETADMYGGLIYGKRKNRRLQDVDGNDTPQVSYNQATQRYINAISRALPLNQHKAALIERWRNTVNAIAKESGADIDGVDPRLDWRTAPINITNPGRRRQMENLRDYIQNQFSISSNEENFFNSWMMDFVENVDGRYTLPEKVHDGLISMAHTNPLRSLRGATFNLLLGWFNPRQLYIQAQNAVVALAVDPINGPAALARSSAMRTMMYMPSNQLDDVAGLAADAIGVNKRTLIQDIQDFRRSGLEDGIFNNADYDMLAQGITGGTMDKMRNLSQKGLVFYREGELFSRMVSWNIAKRRVLGADFKGAISNDDLARINQEVNRIAINFSGANAAPFQRGALGNAFQFAQVQAKLIERILPAVLGRGQWTRAEASRVLGAQIAAYGVVGVPIAEEFSAYLLEQFGTTPTQLAEENPDAFELLTDGMNGWFASVLGFENTFGGPTASLLANLDENAIGGLYKSISSLAGGYDDSPSIAEISFGPSVTTLQRFGDAAGETVNAVRDIVVAPSLETLTDASLEAVDEWLSLASTWNNARKARELFQLEAAYTKSGKKLLSVEGTDIGLMTYLGQGLGFDVDIKTAYYNLREQRLDNARDFADTKRDVKQLWIELQKSENIERFKVKLALSLGKYEDQPVLRARVMDEVLQEVFRETSQTALDAEVKSFLTQYVQSGGKFGLPVVTGDLTEGTR